MKTVMVSVQNNCVPCQCACKYCLLSSEKKSTGIDYNRGLELAKRFKNWDGRENYQFGITYVVGYCADYPQLVDTIAFNRSLGYSQAEYLQCNGIGFKDKRHLKSWLELLKISGISTIDATFYGERDYHDRFANRIGDYDYMLELVKQGVAWGMTVKVGIVVNRENVDMLQGLIDLLAAVVGREHIYGFLPDYWGRGYLMENSRMTIEDYGRLPEDVKGILNIDKYRTEKQWLEMGLPQLSQRAAIISLREDNIDMLEKMNCDEMVAYVEGLEAQYDSMMPTNVELAEKYGDRESLRLYRPRDLFWKWQRQYIFENKLELHNINDERYCCTVRS